MARLRDGEKDQVSTTVYRVIRTHDDGLHEREIAEMTQMERRRVNNYLNELKEDGKIYKDGRGWHAE